MKVFLIILAVLILLFAFIFSISAEFTIIFDNGWKTKIKILFIEKDIQLSKLLSFIVAPEKAAAQVVEERKEEKNKPKKNSAESDKKVSNNENNDNKPQKQNFIAKILDEEGVVGILLLLSNVIQTLNSAVNTLIKGLHIYSLYVKMIIGGGDASDIAQKYGSVSGIYYPIKGFILNGMKVDNFDDYIQPDFIAPCSEYEFQFIGSISVGLLVKVLFKAGKVFVVNLIKNK